MIQTRKILRLSAYPCIHLRGENHADVNEKMDQNQ